MGEYNWGQMQQEATTILEGEFPVTVVNSDAVLSSTGKDMIKVAVKIESGTYAGRKLHTQFTISPESPGAMRMFFSHMNVFGLDNAFFNSIAGQPPAVIAAALDGRRAIAVVVKDVYQGTEREKITAWKPALGGHGGGTFVAGLGGSVGGSIGGGLGSSIGSSGLSSSGLNQPSPSAFNSDAAPRNDVTEVATTSPISPGVSVELDQPSTPAPAAPAF